MTKRTAPTHEPMTAYIGQSRVPVAVRSHAFRRLVRLAAANCRGLLEDERGMTDEKMRSLVKHYRRALFLVLTVPAPVTEKAWPAQDDDEAMLDFCNEPSASNFWSKLREAWSRSRKASPSRRARLQRIADASAFCEGSKLKKLLPQLDVIHAMQNEFGIPAAPITDGDLNAPSFGEVIKEACLWDRTEPELQLGTRGSFFGMDTMHPAELNNCLAIGGTGSGKSRSLVMPLLEAHLRYELHDGTTAAVLVIDPKKELLPLVRKVLMDRDEMDRLTVIGECAPIALFANDPGLSVSDKLQKLKIVGPQDTSTGDTSYWRNLGLAALHDLLQLEVAFARQTNGHRLFATLSAAFRIPGSARQSFWQQLRGVVSFSRSGRYRLKEFDALLRFYCRLAGIEMRATQVAQVYCGDDDMARQWGYAMQSIDPSIVAWSNADGTLLDMDIVPKRMAGFTNVADLIDAGKVVVFCPEGTESHRTVAKALKKNFYEATFARQNQHRPVAIVIDEAHQFITGDRETSEASMIDRVRAYRTSVVLCTQSVSSLKFALASTTGEAQAAADILMINCPSRWVFRTTDSDTVAWLKTQIPCASNPGDPHVIDIRRPSSLRPGEAYLMLANGTWGRKRALVQAAAEGAQQTTSMEKRA